jgi:hypothetical protein
MNRGVLIIVFTDNSHIVALRNTGNVFSYEAIDRLNIKPKSFKDLVTDEPFTRADIITLQDPHNLTLRDMTAFKYIQDGVSVGDKAGFKTSNPDNAAVKSTERILKAQKVGIYGDKAYKRLWRCCEKTAEIRITILIYPNNKLLLQMRR